jgi:hypothetical protein
MDDLEAAKRKLAAEAEAHRKRAERFGTEFVPPNPLNVVARTDARRLQFGGAPGATGAFVTGLDLFTDEEQKKRAARAARFGEVAPSALLAAASTSSSSPASAEESLAVLTRLREAGADLETVEKRAERLRRAERFGTGDLPEDVAKARAAAVALLRRPGDAAGRGAKEREAFATADASVASGEAMLGGGGPRPTALFVTAGSYLSATREDVLDYFRDYAPSWVEFLNGEAVNVLFADEASARRALHALGEPVPKVKAEDVRPVPAVWRVGVRPLVKRKSDRWGPAGTEVVIYLRPSTQWDSKDRAVATGGASVWGKHLYKTEGVRTPRQVRKTDPLLQALAAARTRTRNPKRAREDRGEGEGEEEEVGGGGGGEGEGEGAGGGDAHGLPDGTVPDGALPDSGELDESAPADAEPAAKRKIREGADFDERREEEDGDEE